MKKIIKLNESQLFGIINEAIKNCINEDLADIYHDDNLRDIVLFIENDEETYRQLEAVKNALARKVGRGEALDINYLANSSVIKQIFQRAMRKYVALSREYEYDVPRFDNSQKQQVRLHMANLIFDWLSQENLL